MYVINKEGIRRDFIYTSHDRFLEDIDDYINENHVFVASRNNPIDLMDVVCGHLLYWQYKAYDEDAGAKLIYNELFSQNEIINRLLNIGDPTPELVVYEFGGISVYDELNGNNVLLKETYETFEFDLEHNGKLILTSEEFRELGGEINLPENEDDEVYVDFLNSGDVYFFMTNEQEEQLSKYLLKCIQELNNIYANLSLKSIQII